MHRRCVGIALAAMALGATGTFPAAAEPPSPAVRDRVTSQMASEVTAEIVRQIEALRGLRFKTEVPVKVIDDDQARTYMLERLKHFQMDRQMELAGEAYALLGLLPGKFDLVEAVLGVMREQAGGFYDPVGEVFYLLEDMPVSMLPMITAHELTHALEDQYFDLDARLEAALDDDDRLFALGAVHEGSAMVLMSLFTAQRVMGGTVDPAELMEQARAQEAQQQSLEGLPPVLLRQLMGPYILGAGFLTRGNLLQAMLAGFPTADVDRAFAAGPQSSEQILHPEKFWDPEQRDDPRDVAIRGVGAVLGARWERRAQGVLGELALGVLVGAPTPAADAAMMMRPAAAWTNRAAAGWGGDRWELWKRPGAAVAVAAIEWDTDADVLEFVKALPANSGLTVAHRGRRLALVAGKAGRKTDALLAAALDAASPAADAAPEAAAAAPDAVVPPRGKR